jgi:hypothetical protein
MERVEREGREMRRRFGVFAVIVAALAALTVGGFSVFAGAGAQQPGNNGTIKIFDGDKELPANDPKAGCDFTVRGLNFDPGDLVDVHIDGQGGPNVAGPGVFDQADILVLPDGSWSTVNIHDFPDGQYKVDADDGKPGGEKHKVFRVECGAIPLPTTTTAAAPTTAAPVTTAPKAPAAPQAPVAVAAAPRVTG